jgi:tRNA(fMet)-specific endonuclease VapC
MILIDTNVFSYVYRQDEKAIQKMNQYTINEISTCSIVAQELLYGANKKKSKEMIEYYTTVLDSIKVYEYDLQTAQIFSNTKLDLQLRGLIVGDFDIMIASIAIQNDLILATRNYKDFENITSLKIEKW